MLNRETCASSASLASCRSCIRGGPRPSVATMELLESIGHAEERVMAAWTRIGLAEVDRHNKWNGFVEGRLRPFLDDYVRLQESEERAIAAENDQLFREMFFASLRLKERPRSRELAQLVEAVLSQGAVKNTAGEEQRHGAGPAADGGEPLLDGEARERDTSATLPSFVSVVAAPSAGGDGGVCSRSASLTLRAREDGSHVHHDHENRSPSTPMPDGAVTHDAAWVAFWQLARSMTHQQLHRNLESEVERMNALADTRLQQLCLLYKQRALLRLSPQEQALMRGKYAEKLLSEDAHNPSRKVQQPTSIIPAVGCGRGSSSNNTCERGFITPGPSSSRATTCRSCHSATKDELDLLSDSLPERLRADHECPQLCGHNKDEASIAELQEEVPGRGTIFEVDLGDVTRFGRRQDLSLARIDAEAQEIYEEIVAQNLRMAAQAEKELQCVEELWRLFDDGADVVQGRLELAGEASAGGRPDGERCLPSRQEFASRLTQMRHEYDSQDGVADRAGAVAAEEACERPGPGPTYGPTTAGNNTTNGNVALPVLRSTHVSRTQGRSSYFATISESTRTSPTTNTSGVGGGGGPTNQLPSPLMKLFTTRSYAPILSYIVTVREDLQRRLLQCHVQFAQNVTSQLTDLYRCYFEKTRDTAYYVAPDYSQWLQENAEAAANRTHRPLTHCDNEGGSGGVWQQFLADFTPHDANDNLCERIAEVRHVVSRASAEANLLRHRLRILGEVEPLLQRRSEILEQQHAIQEGSRERLLSKRINMAKQLLFEENARRQFARELPRIYEQLEELLRQWNETMDGDEGHHASGGNGPTVRRLVLHGMDIADLVRQFHDGDARTHGGRLGRSPPPSRRDGAGFLTPQRTPLAAHPITHSHPHPHGMHAEPQPQRAALSTSPAPRPIANALSAQSTPARAKVHAAKKGANPASSVSPAPVKRTAGITRRQGVQSVPSVNDFLRRHPQAVPRNCGSSRAKPVSVSPRVGTPTKK